MCCLSHARHKRRDCYSVVTIDLVDHAGTVVRLLFRSVLLSQLSYFQCVGGNTSVEVDQTNDYSYTSAQVPTLLAHE